MAKMINKNEPKNLPFTISQIDKGFVNNNSKVPCFFSSEKLLMVTAGIKKIKIQGAKVKNGVKSA
ncbi:hypothetical protein D3C72_1916150 [compost metagenome]